MGKQQQRRKDAQLDKRALRKKAEHQGRALEVGVFSRLMILRTFESALPFSWLASSYTFVLLQPAVLYGLSFRLILRKSTGFAGHE